MHRITPLLRFAVALLPAAILFLVSFFLEEGKSGEFSITKRSARDIAMWLLGFEGYVR
jgi:hypothetical protein